MTNKNARVIVPTVLVFWLLSLVVFKSETPGVIQAVFMAAFGVAIPLIVFYLLAEAGWRVLARGYPQAEGFSGSWKVCPTGQMAPVSIDDAGYERVKARFVGALRVGTTGSGLYLSTLFSRVPVLGLFFPMLQIPWAAISRARTYQAPGWVGPASEPGTIFQALYDPNYTGTFVELQVGEPPVFLQLPLAIFGEAAARLPLPSDGGLAEVKADTPLQKGSTAPA